MKLTPEGRVLVWFSMVMGLVGAIFQYNLVALGGVLALALFVVVALHFRSQVNRLRRKLTIKAQPQTSTTIVGASFKFDLSLSNSSAVQMNVTDFNITLPDEVRANVKDSTVRRLLARKSFIAYSCVAQALSPGLFRGSSASVGVKGGWRLFADTLRVGCGVVVEVTPKITEPGLKIETSDPRRLGAGTEVAGIREAVIEEDFRVIDWKGTARTGRFVAKEFLRELIPPAIIVVDRAVLTRGVHSEFHFLHEVARLIVSFGPSTRVGLIIFDERRIVANLPPSVGQQSIRLMINALVAASGEEVESVPGEVVTRSYLEIMNSVRIMKASMANRSRRTIDMFTRSLLPYYENALSNYPTKLWRQGSYQALIRVSNLQQPAFVIVIMGLGRDLSGICEGSLLLNQTSHRVILTVISSSREVLPNELVRLRQLGIMLLQSTSNISLLADIRSEVGSIPRIRGHLRETS